MPAAMSAATGVGCAAVFGEPAVAMIVYVGIFVGIEPDGYVHS
jgi:hypothetical protein